MVTIYVAINYLLFISQWQIRIQVQVQIKITASLFISKIFGYEYFRDPQSVSCYS